MGIGMENGLAFDDFFIDHSMSGFELVGPGPQIVLDHKVYDASGAEAAVTAASFSSHEGDSSDIGVHRTGRLFMEEDISLSFIGRMLMEEDINEKLDMLQWHPALEATEKPFYEILGEKYPPLPDQLTVYSSSLSLESSEGSSVSSGGVDNTWAYGSVELPSPQNYPPLPVVYSSQSSIGSALYSSQSSFDSVNGVDNSFEVFEEPHFASQFRKGVEEARKFLPSSDKLVIDLEANIFSIPKQAKEESGLVEVKVEDESEYLIHGSRGRKNPHGEDLDLVEGRSNKHSAVNFSDETLRSEMIDEILLFDGEKCGNGPCGLQEVMQNGSSKTSPNGHSKGSSSGKARGKRQSKSEAVDLRTLLVHCAQAVATDDRRTANELLKQIRQHSSPYGDGTERLAYCFADGLEARLAGTGSDKYRTLLAKQVTAHDILKAYQVFLLACPFKKISHFFSNQAILDATEKASKVHIIDFGIYFGFQWPCFIKRLSTRPGGPPKLRITGIEVPQPGFRPAERIEETGRRLEEYARIFNVPFKYHAIAAKWETIRVEDLEIDKDETLAVNCLYRLKDLADETVMVDSPRNMVLKTIRKLNPAVFVQAAVNGSYSSPFFVTRFREALFHFSAVFDMLETTVARDNEQRMLIERTIFGRDALNVIACEGTERVDRPESYKQWQVRNHRMGFVQLPLDRFFMKRAVQKVTGCYHKDFVIDEDGRWLLQGWKGRILFALTAWKPNNA